jgi:hypothetical protein
MSPYREPTYQTNSPMIFIESSIKYEIVEVAGQQNPWDSVSSWTFWPSKMRPPSCLETSGANLPVMQLHILGERKPNRTATKT